MSRFTLFRPGCALILLLSTLGFPALGVGPVLQSAGAEEVPAGEGDAGKDAGSGETSPLGAIDADKAKKLAGALKKAGKKKNATEVLPAMEAIAEFDSPEFDKPLLKMLRHVSSLVAVRAAEMWEWRVHDKKVAAKLWKASWGEKKNARRYIVKAKTLKAFARAGHVLDAKQFKEVEREWRWIIGNPVKTNAAALSAIAEYFELMKDKRMSRRFAEELDDPCAGVNAADPSTQPADWQEKRWWLWNDSKAAIVSALKVLTGQTFKTTEDAKKWIQANEKTYGFDW